MSEIIQLNQHIADLIAAGEVVSRPASVVKELLENSIDADAGIITVEISGGGMSYIRVTDNGRGIAPQFVKTAFLRHATSKLRDAKGLEAIETLGFRGEALAAIAAVSRVELLTRQAKADEGVRLFLEAGKPQALTPIGCPAGVTIIVRDLFFNTPARQKFMKTDRAEGSACSSVILRTALSRPDISFRFLKDGKAEYHTPGDSRYDSCIYSLLGREVEAGFIDVNLSDNNIGVSGFISKPNAARGNRGYQFFFVNGRVVRSLLLQSALEQAYKNTLMSGRFPACVLYITTDAENVDVNVHPAKTEVKFISEKQIFDAVYYAALGALEQSCQITVGVSTSNETARDTEAVGEISAALLGKTLGASDAIGAVRGVRPINTTGEVGAHYKGQGGFKTLSSDDFHNSYVAASKASYRKSQLIDADKTEDITRRNLASMEIRQSSQSSINNSCESLSFHVIGEAFNVYIIVEQQDSIWFIDKHAAHERIHFDALKAQDYIPMSEALISPVICSVGCDNTSLLLENASFWDKLGFVVEPFGEDAVAVRYIPSDIGIDDVESVLSEMCEHLERNGIPESANLDKIYKTLACKASVKAGGASDTFELEALAARVLSKEVSHCPHGRPIAFEIPKSTLEKNFGRI